MAIFNSYAKLPEGNYHLDPFGDGFPLHRHLQESSPNKREDSL